MTQTLDARSEHRQHSPQQRVDAWLAELRGRPAGARRRPGPARCSRPPSFWRDLVAFSWNITTVENRDGVADLLEQTLDAHRPERLRDLRAARRGGRRDHGVVHLRDRGRPRPRAAAARRRGRAAGLDVPHHAATSSRATRSRRATLRPMGAEHGADQAPRHLAGAPRAGGREPRHAPPSPTCWSSAAARAASPSAPGCASSACRALVIDKHARPGDQWRSRYKSLCLHDPVWYDHLPYLKFPDNWPVFAPKDKIGDWLEFYTQVMEVPYWSQHRRHAARRTPRRPASGPSRSSARASRSRCGPKQLVLATGMSGKPNVPDLPGQDVFRGDQHHSSAHPGPDAYAGKKVRGDRQQQLRLRHLRRAVGARRRRDDGAALLHPHREERLADGHRPRRPLLRARGRGRDDHREGGPDLRLAAVPDHARVPDPALRADGASATRTSTTGWRRPASTSTGATTAPGCS